MPGDPSEVDAAIIAKLAGDATLAALMTDGVYMDVAPSGKTKFVIVSLAAHEDVHQLGGNAFELSTYLVKAVEQNVSGATVKTAAARIHTLLEHVTLTITGYSHAMTRRAERVRYTEIDNENQDVRWQHRGGRYDVMVSA
jgi:hypothetical protein